MRHQMRQVYNPVSGQDELFIYDVSMPDLARHVLEGPYVSMDCVVTRTRWVILQYIASTLPR